MQSGAYNDALREAYEQGEDISGEGNSHVGALQKTTLE